MLIRITYRSRCMVENPAIRDVRELMESDAYGHVNHDKTWLAYFSMRLLQEKFYLSYYLMSRFGTETLWVSSIAHCSEFESIYSRDRLQREPSDLDTTLPTYLFSDIPTPLNSP
jgi:hypothetical protein